MAQVNERRSRDYFERRARWYDWANRGAAFLRRESATGERRKAVRALRLTPDARVLEVSVGTGTNVRLIAEHVGANGQVVGLDISRGMLRRCVDKTGRQGIRADLVEGEASHLPFAADSFDAVLHHGGFAEFGDKPGALAEMVRVARPGASVVVCDAGTPTDRPLSLVNRLLLRFQPQYDQPPPLELIPLGTQDLGLSWFHRDGWYMIEFVKAN
jgi:ubiquinone/menaquinone biosynthesis C-methylase UbiE